MDKNLNINNKKDGSTIIISVLIFSLIFVSFSVALSQFVDQSHDMSDASSVDEISISDSAPPSTSDASESDEPKGSYEYFDKINYVKTPISNSKVASGTLVLANSSSVVNEDELVPIHSSRTGKYDLKDYSLRLRKDAITNIDLFIMSFYSKYKNNGLGIAEGYKLTSEGADKDLSTGYSVKFTTYKTSNTLSDEDFYYLKEQAFKYGIIQRYPAGKKESTGFDESLSIYRYVGLVHSCYMNHYNLSLEEYLDKIKTEKVIEYKNNYESNASYLIYYVPMDEARDSTYINVPSDPKYAYTVSGDGDNGFIITVKIS